MSQVQHRNHPWNAVAGCSSLRVRGVRTSVSQGSRRTQHLSPCATAQAPTALHSNVQQQSNSSTRVDATPTTKRVYFEVFREVAVGEEILVVGNAPELGAWGAPQGLSLQWHPGHVWKGSVAVPADAGLSYKIVKSTGDSMYFEWEDGEDRHLDLNEIPSEGVSASALWGHPAEYSSCVPYKTPSEQDAANANGAADTVEDSAPAECYTARIAIQKELFLGQHLKLVGSAAALGEWDFRAAPAFTWTPDHVWQLELELPVDKPVDWKVVQAVEGNDEWCEWQAGENTIIDPLALNLHPGDVLQVGCSWDGDSRATIVESGAARSAAAPAVPDAATPEMITVSEEPVYGYEGITAPFDMNKKDAGPVDGADELRASAIASVAQAVSNPTAAPPATVETSASDTAAPETPESAPETQSRGFDLNIFGWGGAAAPGTVPTPVPVPAREPPPTAPAPAQPSTPAQGAAPADTASSPATEAVTPPAVPAAAPAAEEQPAAAAATPAAPAEPAPEEEKKAESEVQAKGPIVSPWDSAQLEAPPAAPTPQPAPPATQPAPPTPQPAPPSPAPQPVAEEKVAPAKKEGTADAALAELQKSGQGLEDIVLSPEQLSALAEAGLPDGTQVTIVDQDDVTFDLQKGRLDKDDEGSTVIVRGGHDYDSETGTVTVTSPLENGPDGLLVDENGKSVEEAPALTQGAQGSNQEPAVKLVSAENIADVKPEDEVGVLTKVGAYAGMAAAGLGAATLMGGLAVDFTDVALVAGLYGVASAIGSSRTAAIRSKGAAGPVLSALVTASDIAKRIKGAEETGVGGMARASAAAAATKSPPAIGKYAKSTTADVSKAGSVPIPTDEEIAAWQAEQALQQKVTARSLEMRSQLGEHGMAALEDGVNQVMSADVQRILKALDSSLSDEEKVVHLVKMLLNGQPAACKTPESLTVEVRAAMNLAEEHVEAVRQSKPNTQHAPAVLLAALAMSAVDEMRGVSKQQA